MMEINNNTFIDILSLPEWDTNIQDVLKPLEEERPIDDGTGTVFISSKKFGLSLMFDYNVYIKEQKGMDNSGSFFLNQIDYKENSPAELPYGLAWGDSEKETDRKIKSHNVYKKYTFDEMIEYSMEEKNKFFLGLTFESTEFKSLKEVVIRPFDRSVDYSSWDSYLREFSP